MKLDSFALEQVMQHVEQSLEGDTPEEIALAKQGFTDLLQVYFDALQVNSNHTYYARLLEAREAMRAIIRICIEGNQTLGYLTRDDQVELCNAFREVLRRIAGAADAHFGEIH